MRTEGAAAGVTTRLGDWPWPTVIIGYFLFQVLWRRLLGGNFGLDEAQMYLWGQQPLALGYGPQPPLYSWVQWAAFRLIPDPLLALSLVKNGLLAIAFLAVYALLRSAYPRPVAGLGALSLMLVPQISWDSQREMTHSVMVVAAAALAALVFWTRALPGRRGGWVGFGLLCGLGALSKANFPVFAVALIAAAGSIPALRPRLDPRGLALAVVVAVAVVAVPAVWAWQHPSLALASVRELKIVGAGGLFAGLREVAEGVFACLALAALVLGVLLAFWRRPAPAPQPQGLDLLLVRTVLIGIGLVTVGVLATGTTHVRDMWILPVVFLGAPAASVRAQVRLTDRGIVFLRRTIIGLAVLVAVALAVHMCYGDPGHPTIQRAPIAAVAEQLATRFPDATRFVADPDWLAGNLIYHRPDLPVLAARLPGPPPAAGEKVVVVWWTADKRAKGWMLGALAASWGVAPEVGATVLLTAPFPPQPRETFGIDAAPAWMPGQGG